MTPNTAPADQHLQELADASLKALARDMGIAPEVLSGNFDPGETLAGNALRCEFVQHRAGREALANLQRRFIEAMEPHIGAEAARRALLPPPALPGTPTDSPT